MTILRAAAHATTWGLALTARLLDAVRLEIEYRLDGRERVAPGPLRRSDDEQPFVHGGRR